MLIQYDNACHFSFEGFFSLLKDNYVMLLNCDTAFDFSTDIPLAQVVIMLVIDKENDRALLSRQSRFVPRMWSCLAGFIEVSGLFSKKSSETRYLLPMSFFIPFVLIANFESLDFSLLYLARGKLRRGSEERNMGGDGD